MDRRPFHGRRERCAAQKKYEGQVFDPSDEIDAALRTIAADARSRSASPWYWRFFVVALFAAGIVLIARDTLPSNTPPVAVIGVLIFGAGLTAMWPDSLARYAMQRVARDYFAAQLAGNRACEPTTSPTPPPWACPCSR